MDYANELEGLRDSGALRRLPTEDTTKMVNLSTNDYLGLADREELLAPFMAEYKLTTASMSASSSRLLTGNHEEYRAIERELGEMYGGRAVLYFNCGYHANEGVLPSLTDKHDLIIADKLVHASLIDGLKLTEATVVRFRHNDMNHLRALLAKHRGQATNCFIVTESIFSMDGDVAPLRELVALKREFEAMLYVDEAHAVGVCGERGEGLVAELGLLADVDIVMCTCGKALCSQGAYVVTSETLRTYLINRCRTLIYTTALPPVNIAWTRYILRVIQTMRAEREHLGLLSREFKALIGATTDSHIVPYICGDNVRAIELSQRLREAGFYVLPIRYPTVPQGQARLRFSLKANMTIDDLMPIKSILCSVK